MKWNWPLILMIASIANIIVATVMIALLHQTYTPSTRTFLGLVFVVNVLVLIGSSILLGKKRQTAVK